MSKKKLFVQYCAKDYLDGTLLLTPEEELAYRRIVDLMYTHGGPVPDDDRVIYQFCKVSSAGKWRKIREKLIKNGKLFVTDEGQLFNQRVDKELKKVAKKTQQTTYAVSRRKDRQNLDKSLKDNETASTNVEENTPPCREKEATNRKPLTVKKEYTPFFEDFWKRYPTSPNMSKQQTFDVWNRALKVEAPETLLKALSGYLSFLGQPENDFLKPKHAATWLSPSARHWEPFLALEGEAERQLWGQRLDDFERGRMWHANFGPEPGQDGCKVPADMLLSSGFEAAA